MDGLTTTQTLKVQFAPVGRNPREWIWRARDEATNAIAISGRRFDSLTEAMRDARRRVRATTSNRQPPDVAPAG